MRKIILFIAMSLDGYIADQNGKVDWLSGQSTDIDTPNTYTTFVKQVDTVILGRNTYEQIVSELSPTKWPYPTLTSYVITHHPLPSSSSIRFTSEHPCGLVNTLKQEPGKAIWICGGAQIIQPLMAADLIDIYDISIIPTLLGNGIRLFGNPQRECKLQLTKISHGNGIIHLVYERKNEQI